MQYKDYYKIMGVERSAPADEIKRAYKRLARKYHPDVSKEPQAEERFKEVGEAYEVLKDPAKRQAYDQLGNQWHQGEEFRAPPGWQQGFHFDTGGFNSGDAAQFSDFFASLFGGGFAGQQQHRPRRAKGEDLHAKVTIDLDDAYHGALRTITLSQHSPDQQGGMVPRQRSLQVRIPKGVRQGQHIRLVGQGGPGLGSGSAGDLYLEVVFNPHPFYRIDGRDLSLDLPLTPWEAALGATIEIPTPSGKVELKIPAGSGAGHRMRLKGRGIPATPAGDLYVVLQIVLPAATSERARQLYQQMAAELPFNPRHRLGV